MLISVRCNVLEKSARALSLHLHVKYVLCWTWRLPRVFGIRCKPKYQIYYKFVQLFRGMNKWSFPSCVCLTLVENVRGLRVVNVDLFQ